MASGSKLSSADLVRAVKAGLATCLHLTGKGKDDVVAALADRIYRSGLRDEPVGEFMNHTTPGMTRLQWIAGLAALAWLFVRAPLGGTPDHEPQPR